MPSIVDCSLLIGGAFGGYWLWQEIGTVNVALLAGGGYGGYYVWRQIGTKNLSLVAVGACVSYTVWGRVRSKLVRLCAKRKTDINIGFREVFKQKFAFLKEQDSNSDEIDYHTIRQLAEKSIKKFIIKNESKPYSFSSSTTLATDTVDCHLFYSHQDLDMPYSCNAIESDHILYMMDVNYSYNLQEWLWKGRPILLYTFCPTTVGGDCLEGTFTITDDKITTIYKNKVYNHQAFDLNMESFVIKGALFSLVVTVDQFVSPMDSNRRVVCLTPTSWYYSVYNWISDHRPNELARMRYQYGNGNILISLKKDKNNQTVPYVSIGYIGEAEILRLDYDELLNTCNPFMVNELHYKTVRIRLTCSKLETFSPMIFNIIKNGWLKPKNIMLAYLKFPETGRSEVEPEDST